MQDYQSLVQRILIYEKNNVSATARRLGVSRSTVRRWRDAEVSRPTTRHRKALQHSAAGIKSVYTRRGIKLNQRGDTLFFESQKPLDQLRSLTGERLIARIIHTVPESVEYPSGKKSTTWVDLEGFDSESIEEWIELQNLSDEMVVALGVTRVE